MIALYGVSERNGYTNVNLLILEPEHLQPVPRGSSPIYGFGVVRRDGAYAVQMLGRTIY